MLLPRIKHRVGLSVFSSLGHTSPVAFLSTPTAAWVNRHRRRQQPGDACQDLPEHPSQHCSLGLWKATNGSSASVQYSLILLGILSVWPEKS